MANQGGGGKSSVATQVKQNQDQLIELSRPARRVSIDSRLTKAKPQAPLGFWHELLSELMYLEATSAYWALQAANPADVKLQELHQVLQSDGAVKRSGETAFEEHLTCLECSHYYYVQGTVELEPCDCGCQYFRVGRHH